MDKKKRQTRDNRIELIHYSFQAIFFLKYILKLQFFPYTNYENYKKIRNNL